MGTSSYYARKHGRRPREIFDVLITYLVIFSLTFLFLTLRFQSTIAACGGNIPKILLPPSAEVEIRRCQPCPLRGRCRPCGAGSGSEVAGRCRPWPPGPAPGAGNLKLWRPPIPGVQSVRDYFEWVPVKAKKPCTYIWKYRSHGSLIFLTTRRNDFRF